MQIAPSKANFMTTSLKTRNVHRLHSSNDNLIITITIGRMNHSCFLLPNLTCASSAVKMKLLCCMMVVDGYGTSDAAGAENEPMIMSVTYFADK